MFERVHVDSERWEFLKRDSRPRHRSLWFEFPKSCLFFTSGSWEVLRRVPCFARIVISPNDHFMWLAWDCSFHVHPAYSWITSEAHMSSLPLWVQCCVLIYLQRTPPLGPPQFRLYWSLKIALDIWRLDDSLVQPIYVIGPPRGTLIWRAQARPVCK